MQQKQQLAKCLVVQALQDIVAARARTTLTAMLVTSTAASLGAALSTAAITMSTRAAMSMPMVVLAAANLVAVLSLLFSWGRSPSILRSNIYFADKQNIRP